MFIGCNTGWRTERGIDRVLAVEPDLSDPVHGPVPGTALVGEVLGVLPHPRHRQHQLGVLFAPQTPELLEVEALLASDHRNELHHQIPSLNRGRAAFQAMRPATTS